MGMGIITVHWGNYCPSEFFTHSSCDQAAVQTTHTDARMVERSPRSQHLPARSPRRGWGDSADPAEPDSLQAVGFQRTAWVRGWRGISDAEAMSQEEGN